MAKNTAVKPGGPAVLPKGAPSAPAPGAARKGSGNNALVKGTPKKAVGTRGSNGS